MYAVGSVAKDAELLFDYGDRYWGALDEGRPVEAGEASAAAAPPKRRRISSGGRNSLGGDAGWEAQLAKLRAYKAARGDCNVPRHWAADPPLGSWVHNQRTVRKRALDRGEPSEGMTAERAAKLEALGFAWRAPPHGVISDEAGWEARLAKLKVYKAARGDCLVPTHWAADPQLGIWVSRQRQQKKQLDRGGPSEGMTAARVAKLEALGFAWRAPTNGGCVDVAGWEGWLAKLEAYKLQHGDCNVPDSRAGDPQLGGWVSHQRRRKKKRDRGEPTQAMTAERAAKLEAIGFDWHVQPHGGVRNEVGGESLLAKLKAYKAAHGDCNVPRGWAEDPKRGRWISKQRGYKKKLDRGEPGSGMTVARAAKLDALDFAWALGRSHE
jgi:hypothetical protein